MLLIPVIGYTMINNNLTVVDTWSRSHLSLSKIIFFFGVMAQKIEIVIIENLGMHIEYQH